MKIGIIAPANIKYTPYIQNYIQILNDQNVEFRIISWNKDGIDEPVDYAYNYKIDNTNRKKMMFGYLKFTAWCKRLLNKQKYDKLIILTVAPACFLGRWLIKNYSDRYILDIRDESPFVFRMPKLFEKVCQNATEIISSSHRFQNWIPKDINLCHNIDMNLLAKYENDNIVHNEKAINSIVYAGMLIEGEINIDIISRFVNDDKLEFGFIGKETADTENVRAFAKENQMKNIFFEGMYKKEDIVDIYREKATFVNLLRKNTVVNQNALPNKLYDAVLAGIPVIVFEHNYAIVDYVQRYSLGIVLKEIDNNFNEKLYEEISRFDYDKFYLGRKMFIHEVKQDMKKYDLIVRTFAE